MPASLDRRGESAKYGVARRQARAAVDGKDGNEH